MKNLTYAQQAAVIFDLIRARAWSLYDLTRALDAAGVYDAKTLGSCQHILSVARATITPKGA